MGVIEAAALIIAGVVERTLRALNSPRPASTAPGPESVLRGALAAAGLLACSGASALSVNDYVVEAVQANPLVLEQLHVYRQVLQDEKIALSGWRPRLDLAASTGQFRRDAPNTGGQRRDFDSQQADVTLSQNLFDGFNTTNQVAQARARLSSAAFQLYDTADNVALDAVQAYLNALTEYRVVELAAQNVEVHEDILAKIRELSERGITRRSDLEQTEGRLARANASLIAQQNNLEDALTQLHTLLGRYVAPEELEEPLSLDPLQDMALDPLVDEALRVHPAIMSARRNIEAARFDYRRSRSANLPTLDLALRQSLARDDEGTRGRTEEGSVVLSLNYNLYRGGADAADQRKKASVMHESKAFLDRVRRQVIDTLRLALSADRGLQGQLPYLERHSRKSLETVELYREEYLLQKRDLIDVLDAEGELNSALTAQSQARYDAMEARYRIYEGLGALFGALNLAVDVEEDDLRIARLQASGVDGDALPDDRDADGIADEADQCDNSPAGAMVDNTGCVSRPTVELGMDAVDLTFQALADSYQTAASTPLAISALDLLANDRVTRRDRPELRAYTQPGNGSVTLDDDGNLIYAPRTGFAGEDEFSYTVGDRRGRRATAAVTVRVSASDLSTADDDVLRLYFGYKQLSLTAESDASLQAAVGYLDKNPATRVAVRAYTDNVGSARYNKGLSEQRADAVRAMLESRGISADRITAEGMGENGPIAENTTEAGRARNRRVELQFVGAPAN